MISHQARYINTAARDNEVSRSGSKASVGYSMYTDALFAFLCPPVRLDPLTRGLEGRKNDVPIRE